MPFQFKTLPSLVAAETTEEICDWIVPTAESCVWRFVALVCNALSGCFSNAESWEMMLVTSSPLPKPVDEIAIPNLQTDASHDYGEAIQSLKT